jgi:hypothetical protein
VVSWSVLDRTELPEVEQLRAILTDEFGLPPEGDLLDTQWAKLAMAPGPGGGAERRAAG